MYSFGRYPHRNNLLQRTSTAYEVQYLTSEKQPDWSKVDVLTSTPATSLPSKKLRILVLHGHKQNAASFKKATKKVLHPLASLAELVFVNGPHPYHPPAATSEVMDVMEESQYSNKRTFWHMSEDPANMHYSGLEESIRYIDEKCRVDGPFQGVIGFSQGGCLAAILTRLQSRQSYRVQHCQFQFVAMISAFPCRDIRPEFSMISTSSNSAVEESIGVSSFHSWGLADTLMDPDRSAALMNHFQNPVVYTHSGGHFSGMSGWPIQELMQWLHDIGMLKPHVYHSSASATDVRMEEEEEEDDKDDTPSATTVGTKDSLHDMIECTFSLNKERLRSTKCKDVQLLRPYGLHNGNLYSHPFWKQLKVSAPLYDTKGITQADVLDFVGDVWVNTSEGVNGQQGSSNNDKYASLQPYYNDLLLLAYCLYPYPSKAPCNESQRIKKIRLETDGEVFYWLWVEIVKKAWFVRGKDSSVVCTALRDLLRYTQSFEAYLRVDLLVCTGCSLRQEEHLEGGIVMMAVETLKEPAKTDTNEFNMVMHRTIVAVMTDQLVKDEDALNRLNEKETSWEKTQSKGQLLYDANITQMLNLVTSTEVGGGKRDAIISNVANSVPRTKGALQKRTRLRSAIEEQYYTLRYNTVSDTETFDAAKKIYCRIQTKNAVAKLKAYLNSKTVPSQDQLSLLKAREAAKWKASTYRSCSEEEYQLRLLEPLSYAVLHPEPEPVIIATEDEMAPLYLFLETSKKDKLKSPPLQPLNPQSQEAPLRGANGDLVFNRGALCMDGRLDLCKQVIGPRGIDSLIKSLALDHDAKHGQQRVQHLLLGNNICGDGLGKGVADLISRKQSGLKTWYIAGNRLTAAGITPVCEALSEDEQVEQLWLKRNPLGPVGGFSLASMLRTNTHLMVLDLTNTALFHEGAVAVFSSLGYQDAASLPNRSNNANTTLRHLYMDANGLQIETAHVVAGYLRSKHGQSHLITLSVACNRFGNEGTQVIAAAMEQDISVQRLVLASIGMGVSGAEALATMLRVNKSLIHLDLGLMKSTAALNELPNRVGNIGAIALAKSLLVNYTLRSLSVLYNNIEQVGLEALKEMLTGTTTTTRSNNTLTKLVFDQINVSFNEFTKEAIAYCLRRNYLLLSEQDKEVVEEAVNPSHLRDIVSVYRVNGNYAH